jgi:hypothetical protein
MQDALLQKPPRERLWVCVRAVFACCVFDWAFHNPYCGMLFRCGCTFPWAGGSTHCNIHGTSGPFCPWCNVQHLHRLRWLAPFITDAFTVTLMFVTYYSVLLRSTPSMAAAAAVAAFLAWGFFMALVFYTFTDYPCFLWIGGNQCHTKTAPEEWWRSAGENLPGATTPVLSKSA